jgi:hypothetical protein
MSFWEFVASVLQSLAWPGVAAYAIWKLSGPAGEALRELASIRYKDFQADFGRQLRKVVAQAEEIGLESEEPLALPAPAVPPVAAEGVGEPLTYRERLQRALAESENEPEHAVVLAWRCVERELIGAVRRFDEQIAITSSRHAIQFLSKKRVIDDKTAHVLFDLRRLRNSAVHVISTDVVEITVEQAKEFARLALAVCDKLAAIDAP